MKNNFNENEMKKVEQVSNSPQLSTRPEQQSLIKITRQSQN